MEIDGLLCADGYVQEGLQLFETHTGLITAAKSPTITLDSDVDSWHQRTAHVDVDGISSMVKLDVIDGVTIDKREQFNRFKARANRKIKLVQIPQKVDDH